jgi:hypothetical protein
VSAIIPIFIPGKAPSENKDFSYDFRKILNRREGIVSATVTGSPSGLSISTATINKTIVTAFISAGTLNVSYLITYNITTDQGRTLERDAILNCQTI